MLGSSLCRLYNNKHKVYAFHRDKVSLSSCTADYSLDLMDSNQLDAQFSQIKPDLVIHCAGLTSIDVCEKEPTLAHEANVTVTENVARICSNETKLVYISTDQVYGKASDHSEINTVLQPVNQYGKTKLQGEQKVKELCTDHLIIRTNIFGWNVKPERMSSAEWIYRSLKKGKEITLFTDYTFSPVYTEYLGDIVMQLFEMGFTGIINVGSPSPCSKHDFGMRLAGEFGLNSSRIRKGSIYNHPFSTPRFHKLDLDITKLISLGITPPDYRDSIRRLVLNKQVMLNTN